MKLLVTTSFFILIVFNAQAQIFERLADKATNAAERTVERKVEQKSQKETERPLIRYLTMKEIKNPNHPKKAKQLQKTRRQRVSIVFRINT
ncbi:MAG TPA: hypothetical protein VKY41_02395 [Xanthomarina sp.]|nr:hypothetical protein [Xanthomarina sp.]